MSTTHLYRSLLRELRLASKQPRTKRSPVVAAQIRTLIDTYGTERRSGLDRTLLETRDFLRSSRIHAELLKRYNPTHDMSQEERVQATARRVGLNAPVEFKE